MYETDLVQLFDGHEDVSLYLDSAECVSKPQQDNEDNVPTNEGKGKELMIVNENDERDTDFSDSEYNVETDCDNGDEDDVMFEKNIDKEVEWGGHNEDTMQDNDNNFISSSSESDVECSGDDFASDEGLGGENVMEPSYPVFHPKDRFNPTFEIGMVFGTKKEFKEAVHSLAVKTSRNLKITSNDKRRIYAKCGQEGCNWHCNALKVKNEAAFQIREYNPNHQCARVYSVKNVKSRWLKDKYIDAFRADPKKNVKGFRNEAVREIRCHVSPFQAYRAKRSALQEIQGNHDEQYAKMWDYAHELRKKNPGGTVIMAFNDESDVNKKFGRLYVCFNALKQGFLSGCRPIVGVDGCHLKGPYGGILLTAVGIDPNNCLFPIAYAVVGSETKQSWEWFLTLLKEDLMIVRNDVFTFISDKQKGLLPAFENVFPGADNRFCVRHLHGNMKTAGWKGLAYKKALCAAATATTIPEFDQCMVEIGKLDVKCLEWLIEKPATQWSRSHFNSFPKCDILLNNLCESFNSSILDAREKPILTMLEWIREYLMTRIQQNRDRASKKWAGKKICPKIKKIVEKNMEKAADCIPIKSNDWNYEISCYDGSRYTVDLRTHICSCRRWELCGIPCKHGMSAICAQMLDPDDFVNSSYHVNTYYKVYEPAMMPMNSNRLWEKTGYIPPLPPHFGRKRERPKKTRKPSADEDPKEKKKRNKEKKGLIKLNKQRWKVHCHFCGGEGHNKKGCEGRKFAEGFPPDEETMQTQVQKKMTQTSDIPMQEQDTQHGQDVTTTDSQVKLTARKRTQCKNKRIKITKPQNISGPDYVA